MDDNELQRALIEANIPGAAYMIVDRDGARFEGAWGTADAGKSTPMRIDTPCQIASMTKALVSASAMQLVERGQLELDAPIAGVLSELAQPNVLDGFDDGGAPVLRPAKRDITLRHLLTHTAGFGYFFVHTEVLRYFSHVGMPKPGAKSGIEMALMFDPGERWEYGVATDWVGQAIEAATGQKLRDYMRENLFDPLGMADTAFLDQPHPNAAAVHRRLPESGFATTPAFLGGGEFDAGGAGLTSTAPDYARFMRAILRGGELDGSRILEAGTVAEMGRNQIGELRAGHLPTVMPQLANPFDMLPDQHTGWGLGFLINPERGPDGRSPGSLSWSGLFNSYFWIDPAAGVAGVFMAQLSPFGDAGALSAFGALERMAYA